MKRNRKVFSVLGILILICIAIIYVYAIPAAKIVQTDIKEYNTRIAIRDDYTLHTTPLDESVINDICLKLQIQISSKNCQPNALVYAPDFFDEIKTYFRGLPNQEKTYATIQDKLGVYLVFCGKPDPDGSYRCRYNLRGDNRYPIFFTYDENDFYYEVIATIGGS